MRIVIGAPEKGFTGPARAGARSLVLLLVAGLSGGCSDESGTGPEPAPLAGRAFVVNSLGGTLSVVGRREADGRLVAQNDVVELGAGASSVTIAVAEGAVAVPTLTGRLLVFDEATLAPLCAAALPAGSSPFGVAISRGDAYVSLLVTGEVARVDLRTCAVEAIAPVGPAPVDIEVLGETLMVVVGNLDYSTGGIPPRLGESYVAFVDALTLSVLDTVGTGGFNAQFAALDREGELLVVNTGDFNGGNSTLTVLDPIARQRTAGPFPLGDSAVDIAVGLDNQAYVTSFSDGLYRFDASSNRVVRGRANPLFAAGPGSVKRGSSGVAVDRRGNVLSVFFGDFATPGQIFLFDAVEALVDSATVGVAPFGVQFEEQARAD